MNHLIVISVAGLCLGLAGCKRSRASTPNLADVAPVASIGRPGSEQPTAPAAQNPRDINSLFQVEAANRPAGVLRVEQVLGQLKHSGVELHEERQHLARPYGARYCVGARAGTELALSVCEYVDPVAAQAGVEVSRKIPLQNREIRVNRATSLTVRQVKKTPDSDALTARVFDSFATL